MSSFHTRCLAVTMGAAAFFVSPAMAQEEAARPTDEASAAAADRARLTYLDLTASLGYSSNPFLEFDDSNGSFLARASARGVHSWGNEGGRTTLTGFVEGTTYFDDYGLKSIFSLNADTNQKVSEKVTIFGSLGFSGDLSGQLGNRFLYTPGQVIVPDPSLPPNPVPVQDPTLFSFAGRQYQLYGQAGASIRTSERGSLTISGGAQRIFYTSNFLDDYTTIFGTASYNHQVSERATVGLSMGAHHTDYSGSDENSTILNPAITAHLLLSEEWDANASVGVSFSNFDRITGNSNSTDLSLDGSICHTSETERLCGRVARYTESQSRNSIVTTSSIGVNWFKRLDDKQTIQLAASYIHYSSNFEVVEDLNSNYFDLAGTYNRKIGNRLSAGADVSVRKLAQDGPDPEMDLSGSLFLRYRLGDIG
jgi:hypothetical protein